MELTTARSGERGTEHSVDGDHGSGYHTSGAESSHVCSLHRFDNLRVPRDALLDKYASVAADGTYSSPIPTVGARFGTMVRSCCTDMLLARDVVHLIVQ